MKDYRRQLAAALAQTLEMRGTTPCSEIPRQAVTMADEVTQRLRMLEAEETATATADRCPEAHPLDGARCKLSAACEHDLHMDDRERSW